MPDLVGLPDQFETREFGIPYDEAAWQAQSIADASHTAGRRFHVEGRFAAKFVQEMLGWTAYDAGGGGKLLRYPPDTHPRFPWLNARSAQFVREVGVNLAVGPGSTLSYEVEEWEVTYQSDEDKLIRWWSDDKRPVGVAGEAWRYCSRKAELCVTTQQLTTGALKYNRPNDKGIIEVVPDGMTGQLIPARTRWITWYQVPVTLGANGVEFPGKLRENIDATVGHMNADLFEGCAPQTLLCLDPKFVYKYMSDGNPCVDITYSLIQRGSVDVSALAMMNDETATSDFTRILRQSGKYGRVFRSIDPARVKSIYEPALFFPLFQFD